MSAPGAPRREVVTGVPRAARPARGGHGPAQPGPAVDTLALRSLMRRQLKLGLRAFALLAVLLGPLPLAFTALPDPAARPGSALAVWAVLGVAVYPALVVIGRWYVVRAERNERDTADRAGGARR
ncbi:MULTISPECIES: hypothetical protein [unclassified Streptomyces]|uniref:hypothetical protein n=1 Tax=unclassified Streptomyces TaxID=2593676 RepID=UPI0004BFEEF6|nr:MULTISPECIES: hypothetical protein [unclassified Streptomyces]KOX07558.1 hypothetical protein ADL04_04370 [Streptomyces sp. NRRL B-3648]